MKIRIERNLLERVRTCADEVDAPVFRWAALALRQWKAGQLPCVAASEESKNATRAGSVVCTLPGEPDQADEMRAALTAAVAYCEARRPPPFKTPLVAGRDYVVLKAV